MKENKLFPFPLPFGWKVLDEKYDLKNDQGLLFVANVLTAKGFVVSIFEAEKGLKLKTFDMMISDYKKITPSLRLKKKFNLKIKDITYPIYIIEGENGNLSMQFFMEKEKIFSFVTSLTYPGKTFEEYRTKNPVIGEVISLLKGAK